MSRFKEQTAPIIRYRTVPSPSSGLIEIRAVLARPNSLKPLDTNGNGFLTVQLARQGLVHQDEIAFKGGLDTRINGHVYLINLAPAQPSGLTIPDSFGGTLSLALRPEKQNHETEHMSSARERLLAENLVGEIGIRMPRLAKRETEVLELLLAGRKVDAIARELGISPSTVGTLRQQINHRFGTSSMKETLDELRKAGLDFDNFK